MKIFAANWKLHKTPQESRDFFSEFLKQVSSNQNKIVFFPPATSIEATSNSLHGSSVEWGSQNCYVETKGAFTGEISAAVVQHLGGKWILLGHSERRKVFGESDELISQKLKTVQALGLVPMLCIGETLEERESDKTAEVIKTQLRIGLSKAEAGKPLAVAYEPVWAIGTGKVASLDQVKEAHQIVRDQLAKLGFPQDIPVLYGGSVKGDNAKDLIRIKNVDGFLVGGASLETKSFAEICSAQ